ncbi:hypothetical protein EMIHUDRAFT_217142 [Emiliania huxleyi CCMP1516]|uniref:Pentapeptide repeat-containing protein n=2 Tax=Emiliania huxleyi TaxID=2903 RepID=A0A0D3IC63_EMIH1|nr:hypothetical protein EMIHUDRAFT_217142 [Emiliania huxleyi CCMP1516]EOD08848.1 hypothetical protein EMIHUDRAFT_217142 [Emiliania huxleyi CCMP1516]|eukprot:XP_005761277.1 hypothetical protein EMIHUDRAFT_217142 [Emiliania huxleyi CCMP1516]
MSLQTPRVVFQPPGGWPVRGGGGRSVGACRTSGGNHGSYDEFWSLTAKACRQKCAALPETECVGYEHSTLLHGYFKLDGVSLVRADLRGADLTEATLHRANASHAIFDGAVLERVVFDGTDLNAASFARAELSSASFIGASLAGASFLGARLTDSSISKVERAEDTVWDGARMAFATLSECWFLRSSFSRADLSGASISGVHFDGSSLRLATLDDAVVVDTSFRRATLVGASLDGMRSQQLHAAFADLRNASLRGAELRNAVLTDAMVSGADFGGARLWGADLSGANLTGASFAAADLTGASFVGALCARTDFAKAKGVASARVEGAGHTPF